MSERKDPSRSSTESPKTDVSPISDGRPTPTLYQRALQRKRLQRKATNANAAAAQTPTDIAIAGTESASAALPHQEAIQRSFGDHDVSHVRSHTGGAASDAARALGASAYAIGDRVGFDSSPDLHTAAHEAAHVVQQQKGVHLEGGIDGGADDPMERHADAVADLVVAGRSAAPLLDQIGAAPPSRMAGGSGSGAMNSVVQRDSSKGDKLDSKEEPRKPPPVGQMEVMPLTGGGYIFIFNSTDTRKWKDPLHTAVEKYMHQVFPGASPAVVNESIAAMKYSFNGGTDKLVPATDGVPAGFMVAADVHQATKQWMHANHAGVRAHEIGVGTKDLGGKGTGAVEEGGERTGKGGKGTGTANGEHDGEDGGDGTANETAADKRSAEDVERARALYERMRKAFPESDAWQSNSPVYPEFLEFLADHADELKKLPLGKSGAKRASIETLKKLLAAFEQQQNVKEGETAHDAQAGEEKGIDGGDKTNKSTDGSKYGEKGGSKYGWIKWDPKGDLLIRPSLPTYVAGSAIKVELQWDHSIHPEVWRVELPNHCSYVWTVKQGNRIVDFDGHSVFADDRTTSLDLGEKPGNYEVTVVANSRHFKNKKFTATTIVKVGSEASIDKKTFDSKQVGDDKAFNRDAKGKLHANPGQQPLTADQEIESVDLEKGAMQAYAKAGKISGDNEKVLGDQMQARREALIEVRDKVKGGTPYLVRGTFVSREDSSTSELKLLMHVLKQKQNGGILFYQLVLHDLTSGDSTQHPGESWQFLQEERPDSVFRMLEKEALENMADHFHAHNDYPKGTVHLAAQRLTSDEVWEKTLNTNNWRKGAKKVLGTVAMIGGVALMIVPGGTPLAVGLMMVSTTAGVASIALELEDRVAKEGKLKFDRRLVLDLLQLASTVLALGALGNALQEASAIAKTRYMLSMTGLDAAQGFMIGWDVRDNLRKIDADTELKLAGATTDEERTQIKAERNRQVAEVIGGAVVSGGFILVSVGGGIKHVLATTRAGRQFVVREPVKALAEAHDPAAIQDAVANQRIIQDGQPVVLTEPETQFLEGQLMQKPEATSPATDATPPAERTTQKMETVDPSKLEENKAPHERTTQKHAVVDPNTAAAQQATQISFTSSGDTFGIAARKVTPEPGFIDVIVHGDPNSFYIFHEGSWVAVKPNSVRKYILRQPGYHGQPIRLISCEAGASGNGIAQAIANGLGVHVKAPAETVWVHPDGRLSVGADPNVDTNAWRDFSAANKPPEPTTVKPTDSTKPTPDAPHMADPHEPLPDGDTVAPDLDKSPPESGNPEVVAGGKKKAATAEAKASELPERKKSGEFVDPDIEARYQAYRAKKGKLKEHPRGRRDWHERLEWWKNNSPAARGNKFNASAKKRKLYPFNEVNLVDGKRLDSYDPKGNGERISRKATDFNKVSVDEFAGYLSEIGEKYPRGKKIRSDKYPELDGKRLKGDPVLEVPSENLKPEYDARRELYEKLADAKKIELRYTDE